jgi:hypothetical protein
VFGDGKLKEQQRRIYQLINLMRSCGAVYEEEQTMKNLATNGS